MNILSHHHVNGELQRSLVQCEETYLIRVHANFNKFLGSLERAGAAEWFIADNPNPQTMEEISGLSDIRSAELEMDFVTELIRLNSPTPAAPPAIEPPPTCGPIDVCAPVDTVTVEDDIPF